MKTLRIPKAFLQSELHDALALAGLPIVTVRAITYPITPPNPIIAMYGVAVFLDSADLTAAQVVVDAQPDPVIPVSSGSSSSMPATPEVDPLDPVLMEAALTKLEKT